MSEHNGRDSSTCPEGATKMRCLEVLLDGEVICRAGDDDLSLLTATLHLLPDIGMQRVIVSGQLEKPTQGKIERWLDMSLLDGARVTFRIIDAESVDAPEKVTHFGTFPGEDDVKYFCSFCGASASDGTPLMNGAGGNICPGCVKKFLSWANEPTGDR